MPEIYVCTILTIPIGCDRTFWIDHRSVHGNLFRMGNESERDRVVNASKKYFWEVHRLAREEVIDPSPIASEFGVSVASTWMRPTAVQILDGFEQMLLSLRAGKDIGLICHCAPKPCHGDAIANYLRFRLSDKSQDFPVGLGNSFARAE